MPIVMPRRSSTSRTEMGRVRIVLVEKSKRAPSITSSSSCMWRMSSTQRRQHSAIQAERLRRDVIARSERGFIPLFTKGDLEKDETGMCEGRRHTKTNWTKLSRVMPVATCENRLEHERKDACCCGQSHRSIQKPAQSRSDQGAGSGSSGTREQRQERAEWTCDRWYSCRHG